MLEDSQSSVGSFLRFRILQPCRTPVLCTQNLPRQLKNPESSLWKHPTLHSAATNRYLWSSSQMHHFHQLHQCCKTTKTLLEQSRTPRNMTQLELRQHRARKLKKRHLRLRHPDMKSDIERNLKTEGFRRLTLLLD